MLFVQCHQNGCLYIDLCYLAMWASASVVVQFPHCSTCCCHPYGKLTYCTCQCHLHMGLCQIDSGCVHCFTACLRAGLLVRSPSHQGLHCAACGSASCEDSHTSGVLLHYLSSPRCLDFAVSHVATWYVCTFGAVAYTVYALLQHALTCIVVSCDMP